MTIIVTDTTPSPPDVKVTIVYKGETTELTIPKGEVLSVLG